MKNILFLLILGLSCCTTASKEGCEEKYTWWHNQTLKITGIGLLPETGTPAQKKLMAERSSKINAIHLLTLQIKNLPVNEGTTVGDYVEQDWTPKGTEYTLESLIHKEDGRCETTLSIELSKIREIVSRVEAK